jgi:hypothetical protein
MVDRRSQEHLVYLHHCCMTDCRRCTVTYIYSACIGIFGKTCNTLASSLLWSSRGRTECLDERVDCHNTNDNTVSFESDRTWHSARTALTTCIGTWQVCCLRTSVAGVYSGRSRLENATHGIKPNRLRKRCAVPLSLDHVDPSFKNGVQCLSAVSLIKNRGLGRNGGCCRL